MSRPDRKLRPAMPLWWRRDLDGCWACTTRNNCNSCKIARADARTHDAKRRKNETRRLIAAYHADI